MGVWGLAHADLLLLQLGFILGDSSTVVPTLLGHLVDSQHLLLLLLFGEGLVGGVGLLLLLGRGHLLLDLKIILGVAEHHVIVNLIATCRTRLIVLDSILGAPRLLLEVVLVKDLLAVLFDRSDVLGGLDLHALSGFLAGPSLEEVGNVGGLVILVLSCFHVGVGRVVRTGLLGVLG